MSTPTWQSLGEEADRLNATWGDLFDGASAQIKLRLTIASVEASGWALGKSDREIESEARKRILEGKA